MLKEDSFISLIISSCLTDVTFVKSELKKGYTFKEVIPAF